MIQYSKPFYQNLCIHRRTSCYN